jgi:hypothetical protein
MSTPDSSMSEWVTIGTVDVESGTLLLVDPGWHRDSHYGQSEVGEAMATAVENQSQAAALNLADPKGYTAGVVVVTGLGDDIYPVEVRYEEGPRSGMRYVAEVRVRFAVDDEHHGVSP